MRHNLWTLAKVRLGLAVLAGLLVTLCAPGLAQAATPISSCNFNITVPGEYELVADLSCTNTSDYGIWIQVSDVELDLNHHFITGSGSGANFFHLGIRVEPPVSGTLRDVEIKGPGLIQRFWDGIRIVNVQDSRVKRVISTNNVFGGLIVGNGPSGPVSNLKVTDNVLTRNGSDGLSLVGTNSKLEGNYAARNGRQGILIFGFFFGESSGNKLEENTASGNAGCGIQIHLNTLNNKLRDNITNGNDHEGVCVLLGSTGNVIKNGVSFGNGAADMFDANPACDANTWEDNKFFTSIPSSCINAGNDHEN